MRPSHLSYAFLGSFLTTILLLQWWQSPAYPLSLWIILGVFGFFGIFGFVSAAARNAALMIPIAMGISVALLSVAHTTHILFPETVDFYAGPEKVTITGRISDDPDRRPLLTYYTVDVTTLKTTTETRSVRGRVLVSVSAGNPGFEYGDAITAQGTLELPGETNGFRYDQYLSRNEVYSLMKRAYVKISGRNSGWTVLLSLFRLRQTLEARINLLFPEPHASLLAGLILGSKRDIPETLLQDFNTTGLTHLIAISGYNITMLVTVMGTLLFWLPVRMRFVPSSLIIIAFTLLTGGSASAVRAALMGILGLLALQTGRVQTVRLSILWTAFFMLAWNPKLLWYDAGFQLSYLALIGVTEIAPFLLPFLQFLPERFGIRESSCLTISAQMLASAWILFLFGQLSLIAPVSNLLAPPIVPYAMLLGFMSVLGSWLWMPLGRVIALIAWLPLQGITGVTSLLGSLPFAAVEWSGLTSLGIVLYYAAVAGWIVRNNMLTTRTCTAPAPRPTV